MNIKSAYRYQLSDNLKAIVIYYIIITCIYVLTISGFSFVVNTNDETIVSGQFGGMEIASAIFLFVAGVDGFKEMFGMLIQNGVSRKSLFISHLYTALTIAFLMATVDKLLFILFKALYSAFNALGCISLYEQIYIAHSNGIGNISHHFAGLVFDFILYLCIFALGYLIRLVYYHMDKLGVIILSVSVPVGLFIVLPIIDVQLAGGRIAKLLLDLADTAFGISTHHPFNGILTGAVLFALFSVFSWLLIRRATVKNS